MRLQRIIEGELNKLFVFEVEDGYAVEAVHYRGDTLCVSTQVGCHVRCSFCASGRHGLIRNLSPQEILQQYEEVKKLLPVKRISLAGIGEPLANWQNVKMSFWEFKKKSLKVSFYTTGFPLNNLKELLNLHHNGVSISIHSLREGSRKGLMPFAGSIDHLINFLRAELSKLSPKRRKKVCLAYMLIKGVNDSQMDIHDLGKLASELGVGVVLLQHNPVDTYEPVSQKEYEHIFLTLRAMGVKVTLSTRFRKDKIGGCGTLTVHRNADIKTEEVGA